MNENLDDRTHEVRQRRDADTEKLIDAVRHAISSDRTPAQRLQQIQIALDEYVHPDR